MRTDAPAMQLRSSEPSLAVTQLAEAIAERQRSQARRHLVIVWVARIGVAFAALGLWHLSASRNWIDPFFISKPSAVGDFLQAYVRSSEFWDNLRVTLQETVIGFAIGSAAGVMLGLLRAEFRLFRDVSEPYVTFLNALPRVALAPMFVVWFGLGQTSKVVLGVSLVVFILVASTESAIESIDPDQVRMLESMGATRREIFQKVFLPGSIPSIFAGLRLGVVYALLASVFGEMLAAEKGLGQQIQYFSNQFQMGNVIGLIIVLGLMALLLNSVLHLLESRIGLRRAEKQ